MANAKPLAAKLRTAAATIIVAAAVASCSSSRPPEAVPATSSSTANSNNSPEATVPDATAPDATASEPIADEPTASATASSTAPELAPTTPTLSTPAAPDTPTSALRITAPSLDDSGNDAVEEDTRVQAPNPVTIRIPRIEVEAKIIPLGLRANGSIEVPENPDQAGWWLGGPEPGEPGPAVILGHVDSQEEGPAVFFYLQYLEVGDEIHIERADGSTLTYVVDSSARHPKDEFPTDEVYGPTEQPTLRLVTCGGDFDFDVRTYEENVIVFASLA